MWTRLPVISVRRFCSSRVSARSTFFIVARFSLRVLIRQRATMEKQNRHDRAKFKWIYASHVRWHDMR
jgi:hypothetical protein